MIFDFYFLLGCCFDPWNLVGYTKFLDHSGDQQIVRLMESKLCDVPRSMVKVQRPN